MRPAAVALAAGAALAAGCAHRDAGEKAAAQRMYALHCGESVTADISRWSPGVNVGQRYAAPAGVPRLTGHSRPLRLMSR